MKKYIIPFIIAVVVIAIILLAARNSENTSSETPDESATAEVTQSGTVTNVNSDEVAFDGPTRITIQTNEGTSVVVAIPSMGLPLCPAYVKGAIRDPFTVKAGDALEVRGAAQEDGTIVPCDSEDHYLR